MSISDLVPWKWGKSEAAVRQENRVDPFTDLQKRMNRLFTDFWDDFGMSQGELRRLHKAEFEPLLELQDKENELVLRAELPGMTEDDIELKLVEGSLYLKGEKRREEQRSENGAEYTERMYGSFYRSIPLACAVKEDEGAGYVQKRGARGCHAQG